ncbi:MAG: exodeoxyribonuclease VII small subunit [Candidatus Omnitrophica bacterium]|nr:exodeoxyribonuclease VII small subunit [Candidatus Omnitrophota bacterium]
MGKKTIKYSEAVEELEEILSELESESVDVDDMAVKVKKAVELIKLCRERIEKTELEVTKIVKEFEKDSKKSGK